MVDVGLWWLSCWTIYESLILTKLNFCIVQMFTNKLAVAFCLVSQSDANFQVGLQKNIAAAAFCTS